MLLSVADEVTEIVKLVLFVLLYIARKVIATAELSPQHLAVAETYFYKKCWIYTLICKL